jgi:predicted transcriptional regulator
MARVLVMSIKPRYADRIFAGEKTVELRRTRPRVESGDVVLVYASAPTKALVGAFAIGGVISEEVSCLWNRYSSMLGVSHKEYREYFAGTGMAHGLLVAEYVSFVPVPLSVLRRRVGFRPPQSYMFWSRGLDELVSRTARTLLESISATSPAAA